MTQPSMTHRGVAIAQVGLSYFFLAGFFGALGLQGLGYIKLDIMSTLGPMAMLVLSFWFQRQRTSADPPTSPVNPASQPKVNS